MKIPIRLPRSVITRETKVGDHRGPQTAVLTHLEALNLDFDEFLHFLEADVYQLNKIQST